MESIWTANKSLITVNNGDVYLLSNKYNPSHEKEMQQFEMDCFSRILFTYRKGFEEILDTKFESDAGWGCMHRTSQMMLGQVMLCHSFGRDWRVSEENITSGKYKEILRYFEDTSKAPFSLHKITTVACKYGKDVGEWLGPSTASKVLEDLVNNCHYNIGFNAYSAEDGVIYKDKVQNICKDNNSLFILVPLRLGIEYTNEKYLDSLHLMFQMQGFVGIIGGRINSSLYFVGYQGDNVFYMDPHFNQTYVSMCSDFDTKSYQVTQLGKMNLKEIDPSMSLGFFFKDFQAFEAFHTNIKNKLPHDVQIFSCEDTAPVYENNNHSTTHIDDFGDLVLI